MYTNNANGEVVAICIALTAADATSQLQQREDNNLVTYGKGTGHHVFVVVGPASNPNLKAIAEALPGSLRRT
jgi:hypothetical protein